VLLIVEDSPTDLALTKHALDEAGAYDRNANAYLVKSLDLDEFTAAVQTLQRFWLDFAILPTQPT
jgi:hypothetical protein